MFKQFCKHYLSVQPMFIPKTYNHGVTYNHASADSNAVNNSQYGRRETTKLNPVPAESYEDVLEESICKALSLTGVNIVPEDLHACHRMKRSDRVIGKFKCWKQKQSLMSQRKNLGTKAQKFTNSKFLGRLFVSKSMSHKNQ